MRKIYTKIVNAPKLIFIIFLVLAVVCGISKFFIAVNYDMTDYLPDESPSTVAIDLMETEYEGGIPNTRLMVTDVTIPKALEYKKKLLEIDGVTDVTWLDDAVDVTQPLTFYDTDLVETYYNDENALFTITILKDKRIEAVAAIREIINENDALAGNSVATADATTSSVREIAFVAIISVLFVLGILILTTTSWVEPFVILIGLGVAIVINAGSNIIFGEISFVTNAAGSILQLAVSLDYSVFLLHRFEECLKENPDHKEAMVNALTFSTSSILSSGLTTVIGFLALCLMQFKIGPDLGLALAKGIAISLITVFVFVPVLILATYKYIDKTRHRSFLPSFRGFGKTVTKIMLPAVVIFAIVIAPCYMASNSNSFYFGAAHIFDEKTPLGQATSRIESIFDKSDTYALIVPKDSVATQKEMSAEIQKLPQVTSVISYVDTVGSVIPEQYLDSGTLSKLNSDNYTRMVISVKAEYEGDETFDLVKTIRGIAQQYYPGQWYLAGEGVSSLDLMESVTADMLKVNLIAILSVFLVLIFTLKSLTLPVILVLGIETAIWINLSIPYFMDSPIFYIAYLIISSIQLGATVDYAILFTDRYCEFRETCSKRDAVINTISTVFVSVSTSASALIVVGFLMGFISSHGVLSQLGFFLGRGSILSLTIVLFVLPGLLYFLDGIIQKTTKIKGNWVKETIKEVN